MAGFDYDVVIIGSGFGGSVAAFRAAEKGYRVGVMESGRRWRDEDIPTTQCRWAPTTSRKSTATSRSVREQGRRGYPESGRVSLNSRNSLRSANRQPPSCLTKLSR